IHRDIKPENVLLSDGLALLADFGIARSLARSGGGMTQTGVLLGTPRYMSPEQAAGESNLDGRSDLYSLACMAYEMLAGVPPFTGSARDSLIHQHLSVAPRPVTEFRPGVPSGVAAALGRALNKAPADRYPSAARLAEALSVAAFGVTTPTPAPP